MFCPLRFSSIGWEEMSLVKLNKAAGQAVKSVLAEKGSPGPVRIELQFTGCCDPSLGLIVDSEAGIRSRPGGGRPDVRHRSRDA